MSREVKAQVEVRYNRNRVFLVLPLPTGEIVTVGLSPEESSRLIALLQFSIREVAKTGAAQ